MLAWDDAIRLDMEFQPGDVQLLHNQHILYLDHIDTAPSGCSPSFVAEQPAVATGIWTNSMGSAVSLLPKNQQAVIEVGFDRR